MAHFSISRADLREQSWKNISYDKHSAKLSHEVHDIIKLILADVAINIKKVGKNT